MNDAILNELRELRKDYCRLEKEKIELQKRAIDLFSTSKMVRRENKMKRDERKMSVLRTIYRLRKKGYTYKRIVEYLEDKGIPTFTNRGRWHAQTIHRLYTSYEIS